MNIFCVRKQHIVDYIESNDPHQLFYAQHVCSNVILFHCDGQEEDMEYGVEKC